MFTYHKQVTGAVSWSSLGKGHLNLRFYKGKAQGNLFLHRKTESNMKTQNINIRQVVMRHVCFPTMSLGVSFSDYLKCKTGFHTIISIFHVRSHQHWAGKNACVVLMFAWGGVLKIFDLPFHS